MIAFANMIKSMSRAESALDRTTADGFATVKQNGTGWTWEPHTVGLGPMLSKPTVPYISQRAAYDGLQRAIAALLREGLKVSGVLTRKGPLTSYC